MIGVYTTNSEFGAKLSFGVRGRSNFLSVFIIWKEMTKEMFFLSPTYPFTNQFKAGLMFVLNLLIEIQFLYSDIAWNIFCLTEKSLMDSPA